MKVEEGKKYLLEDEKSENVSAEMQIMLVFLLFTRESGLAIVL